MTARIAAFALLLVVVMIAACSATGSSPTGASPTGDSPTGSGILSVADAWTRPSTGMALAGAAYLTITNGTGQADALMGVTTPAAKNPELHETTAGESGMMAMRPVERIEIPAGETVKLEPGGYHIMLINLTEELAVGSTIELTLQFEKAAPVTVIAEVRAS